MRRAAPRRTRRRATIPAAILVATIAILAGEVVAQPGTASHPGSAPVHPRDAAHSAWTPAPSPVPTAPRPHASPAHERWWTYMADAQRTSANPFEHTLAPSNASNLTLRWSLTVNGSVFGSPAFVNGTVYFGSWNGYLYAVNDSSGGVIWSTFLGLDSYCYVGGVESSPTIWNNTVYVGGGNATWYAVNASTGQVEWSIPVGQESNGYFNWVSGLVYAGHLYIGVASCSDSPLVWGRLLEVNLTGTHKVFHTFAVVPSSQIGGSIWATPSVDPATNTVWVETGNDNAVDTQPLSESVVALNATNLSRIGSWQVPGVFGYDDDFGATGTLLTDGHGVPLIVDLNKNGVVYALNRSNVSASKWGPVWSLTTNGVYSCPVNDGTYLYLGGGYGTIGGTTYGATIYSVYPHNGTVRWEVGTNQGTIYGGLATANGLVFDNAGSTLEVRSSATGTLLKSYTVPMSTDSIFDTPAVADGQVFFGSGDYGTHGVLYALGLNLSANASASPSNRTEPWTVWFNATVSGGVPNYDIVWQFGDGAVGAGVHAVHTYTTGGSYNATFSVSDAADHVVTSVLPVRIYPAISASISSGALVGVAPFTTGFQARIAGGSGPPYSILWTFGDGSPPATAQTVTHLYAYPGKYTVRLGVSDATGGSNASFVNVTVVPVLTLHASGAPLANDAPFSVQFTASTTGGLGQFSFTWVFGDVSAPASGANVSHTYTAPGSYMPTVTVRDALGESAQVVLAVYVATPVVVSVQSTYDGTSCPDATASYSFQSIVNGGIAPYNESWRFGDGAWAVGPSATHAYSASGQFTVTLTVNDSGNGSSSQTQLVNVATPNCARSHPPPSNSSSAGAPASPPYLDYGLGAAAAGFAALVILLLRRPPKAAPSAGQSEDVTEPPGSTDPAETDPVAGPTGDAVEG